MSDEWITEATNAKPRSGVALPSNISKILEKVHEDVLDVLDRDAVVLYLDSQFHFAPTEARHVAWHVSTRGAGIDCVGLERQVW